METIKYEEFARVELRSGTIVKVEQFERAVKPSFKIWADFGEQIGIIQTSSQMTVHYTLESLIGKKVLGCVNLGEKNIAGFKSQFLLLGFPDSKGAFCLAVVDPNLESLVDNGSKLY